MVRGIVDLLNDMAVEKPYDKLKNAIIRRFGKSNERRLHDLFNTFNLGRMELSQLWKKMQSFFFRDNMSVLKKMCTDRLQTHTTQQLALHPVDLELKRVSEKANKTHENNEDKKRLRQITYINE